MSQRHLLDPEKLADPTRRPRFPLDWRDCPYPWARAITAELTRLWCPELELSDPETYLAELLSGVWGSSTQEITPPRSAAPP